jgi:uncharacterized protein (DUF1015 family)
MNISAFKGYRYDPTVVGNPGQCIAPPYDVIDAELQQRLYEQSEYNIVRITRGMAYPGDNETNNVYKRAAGQLEQFIAGGVLKQDAKDSIYVYVQKFTAAGGHHTRSGFIALGELAEYGGAVKPHEQTLSGPKADRLNLMRATRAQLGQIFMLYSDPARTIDAILKRAARGEPLLFALDEDGVEHRLYALTDPAEIAALQHTMADKDVFIADGHHRYETALNYYRETKNPAAARHLMTFINTHNEGLVILPTHRLIKNMPDFDSPSLMSTMRGEFDIARLAYDDERKKSQRLEQMNQALGVEFETGQHAFGMYFNDGAFYVATLRDAAAMDALPAYAGHSEAWRRLDVAILHKLILEKHLGIDEQALAEERYVEYIKDFGEATAKAVDQVDRGAAQGLFFLNPTRAAEVQAVADAGEKMPQKSTFFFPKIFSGLVVNVLECQPAAPAAPKPGACCRRSK